MNQEEVERATRQRKEEQQRVKEWREWRSKKKRVWYLERKPMPTKK
jgi:hypothetical protein